MAESSQTSLVGGIFRSRAAAVTAAEALRRMGLTDADLASAARSEQSHVIEWDATRRARRGTVAGMVLGALIGAALGAVAAAPWWARGGIWPATAVAGAVVGAVLGAYLGLNRHRPALWEQQDWTHVALGEGEVLLVASSRGRSPELASVLRRQGGRLLAPPHPD